MKNLKKVLSLGLALVMLLGMFTIASAATDETTASDLTDWNTVEHKDAVSLMVDLGIIVGLPDGSFSPTGNIDRASWAKMVYFAATGSDDADAYLGTASGLGDIEGNWAESYISFLKANSYISGDNYGNYNPSDNVTVAEACKMMLTVLGYDAEDRGYQNNTAWSGNIMTDAKRNGLMDNVDSNQTALVALTRENAAEIVLNALNANMVEGVPQWDNGTRYITSYNKLYTLGYDVFNMVKVTATVSGIDTNGYATFSSVTAPIINDNTWGIVNSLNGKVLATADLVGQEVNVYVKAENAKWDDTKTGDQTAFGTFKSVISSSVAKAEATPVKTITSGITRWDDLTIRSASNYVATKFDGDCEYYLNGELKNDDTDVIAAAKLRGTVVEFYTNTDGNISIVKAYKYTVGQLTGDASSKTLSDGTIQVRVPGVVSSYTDSTKVTGWEGLAEDDVVLYYKTLLTGGSNDYSYTIVKAESVTGNVSSFSTAGKLTINGSTYTASEQPGAGTVGDVTFTATGSNNGETVFGSWTSSYTLTDEYDFYLDMNGSIVAGIQLTESLDSSKVCLILATEVNDSSISTSGSLYAELLFVDGSTEIVTVSKIATDETDYVSKSVVDSSKLTNEAKQIEKYAAQTSLTGDSDAKALTKFYGYRSTSSGYELTELNSDQNARNWEDPATVGNGGSTPIASVWKEASFAKTYNASTSNDKLANWDITADSTTTFVVGKVNSNDSTTTYYVYKGFKNVPEMDVTMISAIAANTSSDTKDENTVAKYVYLQTGSFKDDVPDGYILIRDNTAVIDPELYDDDVYLVNIVDTDGTATTMRVTGDLMSSITRDDMLLSASDRTYVGKFFAVGEIDENGVVSSLTNENDVSDRGVSLQNIKSMGNEVISLQNDSYDYDSSTVFVYVDMGWEDGTQSNNNVGTRDENLDNIVFSDSGTFSPNGFYDGDEVNATTAEYGATYKSVKAAVIVPSNSTTADYVYVVRELW